MQDYIPYFIFVMITLLILTYLKGYSVAMKTTKKSKLKEIDRIYEEAKSLVEYKRYIEALPMVGHINGLYSENIESNYLMGACFYNLGKLDCAARAYSEAAWNALKTNNLRTGLYYFNASLMFFKIENWEFTIIRSTTGIDFILKNSESRFVENIDLLVELKVMKLLATTLFFKGSEAFEKGVADAEWLAINSKKPSHIRLVENYLKMDSNTKNVARELMNDNFQNPN